MGAAWADHPWVVLAVMQLLAIGSFLTVVVSRGQRPTIRYSWLTVFAIVNTVSLVTIWSIRLGVGTIPRPL